MSFPQSILTPTTSHVQPLNDDKDKKVVFVDTSKEPEEDEAEAVRKRIEESKAARKEKRATALSETTGAAAGSAADWVRESRKKKEKPGEIVVVKVRLLNPIS